MVTNLWDVVEGNSPILATAIHNGHEVRDDISREMFIIETDRLREEDPNTDLWTTVADTRIVARRSRFEVDLNRPRSKSIYLTPEDSWGLKVWKDSLPHQMVEKSLLDYDAFYAESFRILSGIKQQFGRFVVLDLHSYNHRREGPKSPSAPSEINPEVNIGTGSMDRKRWAPLVDRFINDLHDFDFIGRHLDIRENIKFKGGHFSRWVHETFPETGCALAIEFKKFFMNEWTNQIDQKQYEAILSALQSTIPGLLDELKKIN